MINRYLERIGSAKCKHKRKGIVTSGSLEPGYKGPLASTTVCDREECIADAKDWAFALTHLEATVRMDADRRQREPEVVLIDLPIGVDVIDAISKGINSRWPEAYVDMSGKHPSNKLALVLAGVEIRPREDDDDEL